jgi:RNA polymerase sigma-70 factor (sigma-E family)
VAESAGTDRERLADLYVADYERLVRLARLLGDPADAEDIVQNAFVRVYRRRRLRDPMQAGAYLRQTVVNLCRSDWRHRQVVRRHAERLAPEVPDDPDLAGRLAVRTALGSLPPREREAVVLRYFADLTEVAAAEAMGVSVGSVKGYTSRGLARLGEALGERAR